MRTRTALVAAVACAAALAACTTSRHQTRAESSAPRTKPSSSAPESQSRVAWRASLPYGIRTVIPLGRYVLAASHENPGGGDIAVYDAKSGRRIWKRSLVDHFAVLGTRVAVAVRTSDPPTGFPTDTIGMVEAATGRAVGAHPMGFTDELYGTRAGDAVIIHGGTYATGRATVLDGRTGAVRWSKTGGDWSYFPNPDRLYDQSGNELSVIDVPSGRTLASSQVADFPDGNLPGAPPLLLVDPDDSGGSDIAYSALGLRVVWRADLGSHGYALCGDRLITVGIYRDVHAFSRLTGQPLWQRSVSGEPRGGRSQPIGDRGIGCLGATITVETQPAPGLVTVAALDPASGAQRWTLTAPTAGDYLTGGDANRAYIVTNSGEGRYHWALFEVDANTGRLMRTFRVVTTALGDSCDAHLPIRVGTLILVSVGCELVALPD